MQTLGLIIDCAYLAVNVAIIGAIAYGALVFIAAAIRHAMQWDRQ